MHYRTASINCRQLSGEDLGEPQQVYQLERAGLGAGQGWLPTRAAQDGVLAAPHQADQHLGHEGAAHRPEPLAPTAAATASICAGVSGGCPSAAATAWPVGMSNR